MLSIPLFLPSAVNEEHRGVLPPWAVGTGEWVGKAGFFGAIYSRSTQSAIERKFSRKQKAPINLPSLRCRKIRGGRKGWRSGYESPHLGKGSCAWSHDEGESVGVQTVIWGGGKRAEMGASGWQSIGACRGKDAWPMGEGMDRAGSWDERLLGCRRQQVHR